jgi:hypothetical protein
VLVRGSLELPLPSNGAIDFDGRDFAFLPEPMRNHDRLSAVKEVEHPVLDPSGTGPKLVNAIPEIIRLRSSQFMSQRLQALKPRQTFQARAPGQAIQPFQQRDVSGFILKEDDLCRGQWTSNSMFA